MSADPERPDDWRADAACLTRDPELFYPRPSDLLGVQLAQDVCHGCPVIEECGAYALRLGHPEHHGVWGGMSEDEREQILRRRARGRGGRA